MTTAMIHDMEVDAYLKECVSIDRTDLNGEFMRVSADMAYWNEQYAQVVREFHHAKLDASNEEALLRIEHRARLEDDPDVKRVTESMVESAVTQDDRYQRSRRLRIEAEVEKTRVGGIVDSIRSKRDMLVSLGAMVRAEMKGDPSVLEPRAAPI